MLLSFILPINRDFFAWQESSNTILYYIFQLFFGLTLYAFFVLILGNGYPKIAKFFNLICNKKVIYFICLTVLVITLILTALHIPGIWWTWTSFGVQICTLLLTYFILEKKIQPYEAIITGLGFAGIAIGIWEIPYQWGINIIYYTGQISQEIINNQLIYQTSIELPLIIMGILSLIIINRKYNIINFNRYFWILLAVTIILYVCWFLTGFQQEMLYNWETNQWEQSPMNMIVKSIYRASKVTLALSLISLIWHKKGKIMKISDCSPSFYDEQCNSLNPIRSWFHKARHKTILNLVSKYYSKGEIADLGCGNCVWNSNGTFNVIGVDKNEQRLKYAKKLNRIQKILICEITNIPLPNNSCSVVVLSEVIEHTECPEQVLREVTRILSYDGYLIISVPYDINLSLWKPFFALQCFYQGNIKKSEYYKQHCGHIQHFNPNSLRQLLENAGFNIDIIFNIKRFTIFAVAQKKAYKYG